MPSRASSSRRSPSPDGTPHIDKLDYTPGGRPLVPHKHDANPSSRSGTPSPSYAGSFFSLAADGIAAQQRQRLSANVLRSLAFAWALINCLGAGSITAYSLYAPLFQRRLRYSQLQVNGVSITAELAMYLPVPLWGILCDRFGPAMPSLLAGSLFGIGYILAAFVYRSGADAGGGDAWPYWVMILAFIPIGCGTSCMYLSAVTTCAKNFGRGKYKGLALALPIACFGLSGMWESQVGSRLLYERRGGKGEVDVYRFFLFLGCFLFATGVVGFFALRIVGEEELIDEAVEELEASGLLDSTYLSHPTEVSQPTGYGTVATGDRRLSAEEIDDLQHAAAEHKALLAERERKKTWLLNEETKLFLSDHTMWWLAAGFFLVTGPGEAFINNLGTIIGTLYPPSTSTADGGDGGEGMTTAATHVSIVAVTSTIARILTGTLTDLLAPTAPTHQHRRNPSSLANSTSSLPPQTPPPHTPRNRLEISRVSFLLAFGILLSIGQVILASAALQGRGDLFWLVSGSIGAGYGATFSLTPIIVSVVWGVENFGTNWGVVATVPAAGATVWGLVYAGVYGWAAERRRAGPALGLGGGLGGWSGVGGGSGVRVMGEGRQEDVLCYGAMCYAPTFWAMAVSVWVACGLWVWAWRGPGGWFRRGILV